MKIIYSNLLTIFALLIIFTFYPPHSGGLNYWGLLSHKLVLNIGVATVAIIAGYFIKNYLLLLLGASFALAIYSLVLMSTPESDLLIQFFLAIYTVFLAFSVAANLFRQYKDWLLSNANPV
jgi:hypothetical protein